MSWKTVQEVCLGKGHVVLNKVRRLVLVLQCHLLLLPNEQEAVMEFSLPEIWRGVIGHVLFSFNLRASVRIR